MVPISIQKIALCKLKQQHRDKLLAIIWVMYKEEIIVFMRELNEGTFNGKEEATEAANGKERDASVL